jgi:hypothetical protein
LSELTKTTTVEARLAELEAIAGVADRRMA